METLKLTDSQWCDIVRALRATAEADAARAVELKTRGLAELAPQFAMQAIHLAALADIIEAGESSHAHNCASLDCSYDPRPCDCSMGA